MKIQTHHIFAVILLCVIICFHGTALAQTNLKSESNNHSPLALPEFSMKVVWNRSTWESMILDIILSEDFESEQTGYFSTPYVTANGIIMDGVLGSININIISQGLVDGSIAPHFQDFGNKMKFIFPDTMAVAAFGFDFHRSDEIWELHVRDTVISLQPMNKGFIGIVMTGGDTPSFILTSPTQGGLSIDNITFSPSYGLFTIFDDRANWESSFIDEIITEDFESERAGVDYTTPFLTNGNILMDHVLGAIIIQIFEDGLVDNSQAPHFKDFSNMLSVSFPDRRPVSAFAFDYYYNDPEVWELHIEDSVFVLPPVVGPDFESKFVGIMIPVGSVSSLVLTSPSYAQGGISIDNLSYVFSSEPILIPLITNIQDIPFDQGKQVRVTWRKSILDGSDAGDSTVIEYSLWRRINENQGNSQEIMSGSFNYHYVLSDLSLPPGEWDFVETIPATGYDNYNVIAPTIADSSKISGIHWSIYMVLAHTSNPLVFYISKSDSGYSLDNLVPHAPEGVLASVRDNNVDLIWRMVPDEDFKYYAIYRSTESNFDPKGLAPYATTVDTSFADSNVELGIRYYYRISAFDFSGNQGEFSPEVSAMITGIEQISTTPKIYKLYQNFPNPFNPVTQILFDLPKTTDVSLKIFNSLGEELATFVSDRLAAGSYSFEWDASNMASGVYLYRLSAGSLTGKAGEFVRTKKMILMR